MDNLPHHKDFTRSKPGDVSAFLLFLRMVNGDLWALSLRMWTLLSTLVPMNRLIFAQSPKTPGRLVSFAQ